MQEIWDSLWPKRAVMDIDEVIAYDSCYNLLKRLIRPLPENGLDILEVGCGSGIYTLSLLKQARAYLIKLAVLADYSTPALAFAGKNADKNDVIANLVLADAFRLPFADGTFDIVWNEGVNEHFSGGQRQQLFDEMARVCKPGGQVIVIVPNSLNIPYRLWKAIAERQGRWGYGIEIPYSVFELRSKLNKAGLTPAKSGGRGTLASLAFFGRIFARGEENNVADGLPMHGLRVLRKVVVLTDSLLGFIGGFTGAEIGVKGLKPVKDKP